MNFSLNQIELFITIAKYQSFTKAAEILNVTRAAASQTIKQLEQQLGVDLFIRTTRKVTLTEEGELLYEQAEKLLAEKHLTQQLMQGFHKTPSGKLRISANPWLANTLLIPILNKYLKKYPNMQCDIICEERMPNLHEEKIDLVFGVNWPAPDDVVAKIIGKTKYVLCASPAYLKKYGKPKQLNDLKNHRFIHHLGRKEKILMDGKNHLDFHLQATLCVNHVETMKQLALNDFGIVLLHDYIVKKELADKTLIELLPKTFAQSISLYIYYQKNQFVQPKIRAFVNMINVA